MASSDQPKQTKPSGRRVTRITPVWAWVCACVGAVGLASVASLAGIPMEVRGAIAAAGLGFVAALIGATSGSAGRQTAAAASQASQERLTDAEQALEDALRQQRLVQVHNLFKDERYPLEERQGGEHGEPLGRPLDVPPPHNGPALSHGDDVSRADLALPELWGVTHRRLGHYHSIATKQAERSFWNAQVASVTGFVFLVAFVVVALTASTTTGSIVAGGLGAVSAALAGFVSRTFVRSQEAAASHLRSYFDQPLELSRFLAAERLIADANLSEGQRAEVLTALVQAMAAGPAQQPPLDTPIPSQRGV